MSAKLPSFVRANYQKGDKKSSCDIKLHEEVDFVDMDADIKYPDEDFVYDINHLLCKPESGCEHDSFEVESLTGCKIPKRGFKMSVAPVTASMHGKDARCRNPYGHASGEWGRVKTGQPRFD